MEDQIEDILQSGDPDAIDALLTQLEAAESAAAEPQAVKASAKAGDDQPKKAPTAAAAKAAAKDAEATTQTPAEERWVESKHGNGRIPYGVLEGERSARQAAERELAQMQQQVDKNQRLERRLDLLTKQLEGYGLEADTLPEDFQLTADKQRELIEDYGDAGKLMVVLYDRLNGHAQSSQAQPEADPVLEAIARNAVLESWRSGGDSDAADRFSFAVTLDQQLRNDPNFANASLDERFAEVVKRTQAAFGDAVRALEDEAQLTQKVDQVIRAAEAAATPPTSLSEMGTSTTTQERTLAQRLESMDAGNMMDKVMSLDSDQLDALFDQLS